MDIASMRESAEKVMRLLGDVHHPLCTIVLGSGWSGVASAFTEARRIEYGDIPCLGASEVEGHTGGLMLARCRARDILIFQGRRHWYETGCWEPVAFPVYLARLLGSENILLTNAAGGLRGDMAPGTLMVVDDHINAMGANPLVGNSDPVWGAPFPDQTQVYSARLRAALDETAAALSAPLAHGVYLAVSGPAYETPAEIRAFRAAGADAIGMSTVPEAMLANAAGLQVAAVSCITNMAAGLAGKPLDHQEVLATTQTIQSHLKALIVGFVERLA